MRDVAGLAVRHLLPLVGGRVRAALAVAEVNAGGLDVGDADHGRAEAGGGLAERGGILVVRHGAHDGGGALGRVARLEDAGAHEDTVHAELHHEGGVGRGGHAAGGEVHHRELAGTGDLADEVIRGLDLLGKHEELVIVHGLHLADLAVHSAGVAHGLDDVAGAGLALGAEHGGTLGDAAERLAEVAAAADEGNLELVLVNVVLLVGHGEHLGLIDIVDLEALKDLGLHEVSDARLGHDRDAHGLLDLTDHLRVGHARDAALGADVGGDALQGHDGHGASLLGHAGLLHVHHVHDDTALEHLGEASLHAERARLGGGGAIAIAAVGSHG
mmetsp:Transcript_34965/g.109908  ORF Transcript_34965/g.109908 Transcript_34965/m.109908 type:complete len:329 (-) Transcript_34965:79-1065(-)